MEHRIGSWHALTTDEALEALGVGREGLTSAAAAERLKRDGPNRLAAPPTEPLWRILWAQLDSVVVILLLVAAAVAAGADGLMIEVHDHPDDALSDGNQALTPDMFAVLMDEVRTLAPVVHRGVPSYVGP